MTRRALLNGLLGPELLERLSREFRAMIYAHLDAADREDARREARARGRAGGQASARAKKRVAQGARMWSGSTPAGRAVAAIRAERRRPA